MSSANISWLFYKDYFADINYQNLDDKNNVEKIKQKVQNIIDQTPKIKDLNDEDILGNTLAGKVVDQNYSYKDYPSIMKYNKLNAWDDRNEVKEPEKTPITYIVKSGDNLSSIAEKYNTTWQKRQNVLCKNTIFICVS